MSVATAKKIVKDKKVLKGVFLIYDSSAQSIEIEKLPAGTQKSVEFKLV